MTLKFTEESIQNLVDQDGWWLQDSSKTISRGRLIQAYAVHVDQIPNRLLPAGRTEATVHTEGLFEIGPFRYGDKRSNTSLPVAALPVYPNEEFLVLRAKRRPLLVIADNSIEVDKKLIQGKPKYQTAPTVIVAPYYGKDEGTGARSGYTDDFVARVRQCEYPQFFWDKLPLPGVNESILRFDHIQPIGSHYNTYDITEYRLSDDALMVMDEWLAWYVYETLDTEGLLACAMQALQQSP